MEGDDRVRFCGDCRLNVYNLSAMTSDEALTYIDLREGRTCVRLYRRADGTVSTRDCPVGLRAMRHRAARSVAFATSMLLATLGTWLGWTRPALETLARAVENRLDYVRFGGPLPPGDVMMGIMAVPLPVLELGEIAPPFHERQDMERTP